MGEMTELILYSILSTGILIFLVVRARRKYAILKKEEDERLRAFVKEAMEFEP